MTAVFEDIYRHTYYNFEIEMSQKKTPTLVPNCISTTELP
jgi:hypothetical protein